MGKLKRVAVVTLLGEYHRQLEDALNEVQAELTQNDEAPRERAWKPVAYGFHLRAPTEEDDPSTWHWVNAEKPLHPALIELSNTIYRMSKFIDELKEPAP